MSGQARPSRHPNAPPVSGPRQRRLKMLVFIAIFGPMVVFGLYHMGRGVMKMIAGEPVGYRAAEERYEE
jgi:hypothetical protein